MAVRLTRRDLLVITGLTSTAIMTGCSSDDADSTAPTPSVSDQAPADPRVTAGAAEWQLVARYEATIAAHPQLAASLTPFLDHHKAHAAALGVGRPADATIPGSAPKGRTRALAVLAAAEATARDMRIDECVLSEDPDTARLLAVIAASEASHAQALEGLLA